jgi:serine/threonine protein kinase
MLKPEMFSLLLHNSASVSRQMPPSTCARCGAAKDSANAGCPYCDGVEQVVVTAEAMSGPEREQLERLRAATLGEYDVYGELGRGGMATVYLAHDIALDRKVAIKVMLPSVATGDGIQRFKREARTSASLSHPNIIPIYAVRHTEDLLYFVMKYVDGRPLDGIIRELGPLPIPMVQALLGQMASAFGYAHRRGVVHRDIKPGNILIDDEGWAVVTDFGIARVAEAEALTTTGLAVGTPIYMSPEQCLAQDVTGASDQYSLGVVAYEMLTGQPPFHNAAMMALMYSHVHTPPPPIESKRPDCPEGLRNAVMRMLAKHAEERWPSVEDAAAEIGTPPMAYDDPTRSQLIALARTGSQQRLAGVARTPRSPIPMRRTPPPRGSSSAEVAPAAARPRWAFSPVGVIAGLASAALVSASVYYAPWRTHAPAAAETASATPASDTLLPRVVGVKAALPEARPDAAAALGTPVSAPASAAPAGTAAAAAAHKDSVAARAAAKAAAAAAAALAADRAGVDRAIQQYMQTLESGNAPEARRAFPGIGEAQYSYLAALFGSGGKLRTRWKVTGISISGDSASARIRGYTEVLPATGSSSRDDVDNRATLERSGGTWRLRALKRP